LLGVDGVPYIGQTEMRVAGTILCEPSSVVAQNLAGSAIVKFENLTSLIKRMD